MKSNLPTTTWSIEGRQLSYAGFGCSSIWARSDFDESAASSLLDAAYAGGVRMLDTGPSYGLGEGEKRLGRWLRSRSADDAIISTKVGTNLNNNGTLFRSFQSSDMERSLTQSLQRLGKEQIDVLYLHGPKCANLTDEVMMFFDREKQRGRICWSGVNSFEVDVLARCVNLPINAVMLQYNVSDRSAKDLIPLLKEGGKAVFSGTALAQAIYVKSIFSLRNRYGIWYLLRALKNDPLFYIKGRKINREAILLGKSGIEFALNFVLQNREIDGIFFGTSRLEHMNENMALIRQLLQERANHLLDHNTVT